jgi:putative phage-type endonuclease
MNIDIGIDIVRSLLGCDDNNVDRIFKRVRVMFPHVTEGYVRERINKVRGYRERLGVLRGIPVVEQRSPEWYEMRTGMITASDFGVAMGKGKFMTLKDLYKKKCGYEEDTFTPSPPTEWGVKYEPVACSIYEILNYTEVHEFGLIRDMRGGSDFMGASPDGINDNGVMVEIKCPYNTKRPLNGQIIDQYFIQIQGQLDVCELEECDFFECIFNEYYTEGSFVDACDSTSVRFYGAIIERMGVDGRKSYTYSSGDDDESVSQIVEWVVASSCKGSMDCKVVYWVLRESNQVRVYRKEDFFFEIKETVRRVWDKILMYRSNKSKYDEEIGTSKPKPKPNPNPNPNQKRVRQDRSKFHFIPDGE